MKKLAGFLLIIAMAPPLSPAYGAGALEKTIARAQAAFDRTRGMTANFTQKAVNKGFGRVTVSRGVFYMRKPGRMRWEYREPAGLLLVADGVNLWYYDPADNTVYLGKLSGYMHAKAPAMFLAGEERLVNIFNIRLAPTSKKGRLKTVNLRLDPKRPQPGIKAILLKLNAKTYEIAEVIIMDQLGNTNRIKFSNVNTTARPATSRFKFTVPAGARVKAMNAVSGQRSHRGSSK